MFTKLRFIIGPDIWIPGYGGLAFSVHDTQLL